MLSEKKEEVFQYIFQKRYALRTKLCTKPYIYNMLIMVPLFLDRHTLHAERCREISTATGIANKGCKLTTQPLPPVPDCYYESPVPEGDDHEPYYLVPIKVRVKWFHRIHFPNS